MTAIFMLAAAVGLFLIGWIFSGGVFHNVFSALNLYAAIFLIVAGIVKGLMAILTYDSEEKEKKE